MIQGVRPCLGLGWLLRSHQMSPSDRITIRLGQLAKTAIMAE
mgnify:CR=1 FL=1